MRIVKGVDEREFPLDLRGTIWKEKDQAKNKFTLNGRPCHAVILCMPQDSTEMH